MSGEAEVPKTSLRRGTFESLINWWDCRWFIFIESLRNWFFCRTRSSDFWIFIPLKIGGIHRRWLIRHIAKYRVSRDEILIEQLLTPVVVFQKLPRRIQHVHQIDSDIPSKFLFFGKCFSCVNIERRKNPGERVVMTMAWLFAEHSQTFHSVPFRISLN